MVKILIASSMIALVAVTLLVGVESVPVDWMKAGQDMMSMVKTGMEVAKNFDPATIKEITDAMKNQEERDGFMKVITMLIQGKPMSEVADVLLDMECGGTIATALMPAVEKMSEMKEKYGKGLQDIAKKEQ